MILLNLDFIPYSGLIRKVMKTLICTATSLELGWIFPSITPSETEKTNSGFEKCGMGDPFSQTKLFMSSGGM